MKMCIFIEKVSSLGALKLSLHCLSSFAGPKKKSRYADFSSFGVEKEPGYADYRYAVTPITNNY